MRTLILVLVAIIGLSANAQTNKGKPQAPQGSNGLCKSNQEEAWLKLSVSMGVGGNLSSLNLLNGAAKSLEKGLVSEEVLTVLKNVSDFSKLSKLALERELKKATARAQDGFQRKVVKIVAAKTASEVELLIKATELLIEAAKDIKKGKAFDEAAKNALIAKVQPLLGSVEVTEKQAEAAKDAITKLNKSEKAALGKLVKSFEESTKVSLCEAGFKRFVN